MVSPIDKLATLIRSWAIVVASLVLLGFLTKATASYSRGVLIAWWIAAFLGQWFAYVGISWLQSQIATQRIPTIVVGTGQLALHLATQINANRWMPDQVVGVLANNTSRSADWLLDDVPVLGCINDIRQVIADHGIHRIYIALPLNDADQVKPLYLAVADRNIDVIWAPDIFGVDLANHSLREVSGVPLITLSESPLIGSSGFVKSLVDYTLASIAMVVLSPVLLAAAIAVKLSSPGPILFRQKRHGWDGRIITVYKFRTMKVHSEEAGKVTQACRDDSRVTKIGRFMRKTSIDELPQLINVLNGTMSLVGPRPHAIVHNEYYSDKIKAYMLRHRVKPGLTGLAQVNGLRGETQTVESMAERVSYDLVYINNWSLWLDIKIMFRTVFVLIGDNVY